METRRIRVGIDVGSFSVGMTTIEVDEHDHPLRILSSVSHIHDSGLDKDGKKTAKTRREVSGVARRTRRLMRERRRRLKNLDSALERLGYPIAEMSTEKDPYFIWRVRAQLVEEVLPEETRRYTISMALRHIARHRGWRNPYAKAESLLLPAADSQFMEAMRARITERTGEILPEGLTPGQTMQQAALTTRLPMRGQDGLLGKLHQSDNANEIRQICSVQGISEDECKELILAVFAAKSPRGSAAARVGRDPLPGQGVLPRAPKCDPEFQKYRIISIIANLRLRDGGGDRPLSSTERRTVTEFLLSSKTDDLGWVDVADLLGVPRQDLRGTAGMTADGERASAQPPVDVTDRVMRSCKIKDLQRWWNGADSERRSAMVLYLYEGTEDSECAELLSSLPEEEQGKLDNLHLPAGRAAYSRDSLSRLNEHMMTTVDDVHEARKAVFGVDDTWKPPAEPIGAPVGNPAVDRTVKAVARYLNAVQSVYGTPASIQVEHVRDGFASERTARELDANNNRRYQQNQRTVAQIQETLGVSGAVRRSDVMRYEAIMIQDGTCVYCGQTITYHTAQLDHIVPQAGVGSNNHRENLVAVCERCNRSKSKTVFSVWAGSCGFRGVSVEEAVDRVKSWRNRPGSMRPAQLNRLKKDVIARLRRTQEDPELDGRSIESVAWMANELHHRISAAFPEPTTHVAVYRGSVTAGARRAVGIDSRVNLLGEKGIKDRLDRRHHAIDAAVIALMRPEIAKTLAERSNLRSAQFLTGEEQTWKQYTGRHDGDRLNFERWSQQMLRLTELLNIALANDEIHIVENLRLRLGNGAAHDDTIRSLDHLTLGEGLTANQIDRAASPALWCALTRQPDYDVKTGLPANPERTIKVHGHPLGATDTVEVFRKSKDKPDEAPFAALAVRGGFAEIGSTIHHARVYRIEGKKPVYAMLRVFACDLLKHRQQDLFSTEILPQSISMRCAEPKLRQALSDGSATYLGWIVAGDELEIPMDSFSTGKIATFNREFPTIIHWRLRGFETNSKLTLRPSLLSLEGLPSDAHSDIKSIFDKGWRVSINQVAKTHPVIARHDTLGRLRSSSFAGLPTSWRLK